MNFRPYFRDFTDQLHKRMIAGERTYGEKSFHTTTEEGISEIQQELLDTCGWALVEWIKLEILKESLTIKPLYTVEPKSAEEFGRKVSIPVADTLDEETKLVLGGLSLAALHLLKGVWPIQVELDYPPPMSLNRPEEELHRWGCCDSTYIPQHDRNLMVYNLTDRGVELKKSLDKS